VHHFFGTKTVVRVVGATVQHYLTGDVQGDRQGME
jgi:hypothetical protein